MGLGRASFVRAGVLIMAALFVSGCASPSEGLLVALPDPALAERTLTVLAVTTRSPAGPQQTGQMFSGERASGVHYVSLKLSMPPDRALGALPTDARKQDPTKNIVLVSSRELSRAEFTGIVSGTNGQPLRRHLAGQSLHVQNRWKQHFYANEVRVSLRWERSPRGIWRQLS